MAELGSTGDPVHLVDGFPLPVCHFRRAKHCRRFKGSGSYGYCASKREAYFGFEGHLLVDLRGVIVGFTLTPANKSEREAVWELTDTVKGGLLLGDKGYLGTAFQGELLQFRQIELEAPVRHNMRNMRDPLTKPWRSCLNQLRRRVETTIGQLVERFNIQKIRARTLWSLTNRLIRKLLAHGLAVLANIENELEPLQLSETICY